MVTAKKAAKAVGVIIIIGIASKILGFVREMVLANYYGATAAMDAYYIAYNIPGILLAGLGGAVATTFIPTFTRKAELEGKEAAFALSRKLFTAFTLVGLALCVLGIAFEKTPLLLKPVSDSFSCCHIASPGPTRGIFVLTTRGHELAPPTRFGWLVHFRAA